MNIRTKHQDQFEVELSLEEVRIIHQAINEVCHGFKTTDFDAKIGDRNAALAAMEELGGLYGSGMEKIAHSPVRLDLTFAQICLFRGALAEVCREIEDWEFDSRMGISKQEAQQILTVLSEK